MRIYCDLDEVITDFVGGACVRASVGKSHLLNCWTKGVWGIEEPMRLAYKIQHPDQTERFRKPSDFWNMCADAEFWVDLQTHTWADRLLSYLKNLDPEFKILTSPTRSIGCWTGKVTWFKRYFGETFDNFIITPHKHLLASRDAILIDDREETIERWNRDGGKGILFPAHHNSLHALAESGMQLEHVFIQMKIKTFQIQQEK